jgi:branched-chain amino acid transport system ATP-binding protein
MNDGSLAAGLVSPSPAAPGGLDISGVTVRFGGLTALDDVSLSAAPRQVTGIIGPNGAGKTTLLNAVCGFVKPESGTISFDSRELTGIRPHRLAGLGIARTLQGVGLFRGLSVVENVMVGATHAARAGFWSGFFGLPRSDRDERRLREQALQALGRVGVRDLADSMPETLAFGLRKRVALARALVGHPRLLLLDEPASGLSENELPELGDLITSLAADAGVVVIEHRMDLVMSVCDTIFVLDFGKLIATGTPEQVQADPAVTAAYLGTEVGAGAQGEGTAGRGSGAGQLADLAVWREDADREGAARAEEAGHE